MLTDAAVDDLGLSARSVYKTVEIKEEKELREKLETCPLAERLSLFLTDLDFKNRSSVRNKLFHQTLFETPMAQKEVLFKNYPGLVPAIVASLAATDDSWRFTEQHYAHVLQVLFYVPEAYRLGLFAHSDLAYLSIAYEKYRHHLINMINLLPVEQRREAVLAKITQYIAVVEKARSWCLRPTLAGLPIDDFLIQVLSTSTDPLEPVAGISLKDCKAIVDALSVRVNSGFKYQPNASLASLLGTRAEIPSLIL